MSMLDFIKGRSKSNISKFEKMGYNYSSYQFMPFPLRFQKLPYDLNDLEPFISKQTMYYHYNKHYKGYIEKLNSLIEKTDFNKNSLRLSDLLSYKIAKKHPDIYNNAAQVWNHTFYWNCLSPRRRPMSLQLRFLIHDNFGSYDKFKEELFNKAHNHFGSGWIWLVKNLDTNKLEIITTKDAYNPLTYGKLVPVLVLDMWEHAYYLDSKNNKDMYIESWFEIINWEFVEKNIIMSKKLK